MQFEPFDIKICIDSEEKALLWAAIADNTEELENMILTSKTSSYVFEEGKSYNKSLNQMFDYEQWDICDTIVTGEDTANAGYLAHQWDKYYAD